jgi:tetratricopeptide (TPR) repeat protein
LDRQYADAWAFVHYVVLGRSEAPQQEARSIEDVARRLASLLDLAARLRSGETLDSAVEAVLGEPIDRISDDYEVHRDTVVHAVVQRLWHFVVPVHDPPLAFEPLSRAAAARELASYAESIGPEEPIVASLWDCALDEDRDEPRAVAGRVRAAIAVDDLALARALWGRLSEEEQQSPRAAWTAGLLAHAESASRSDEESAQKAQFLEEARRHYRRVLATEPDRVRVLAALGATYVLEEDADPSPGIASLERALQISPRDPEVRLDLAKLLRRKDSDAEAQAHLRYVIETYPDSVFARRAEALRD